MLIFNFCSTQTFDLNILSGALFLNTPHNTALSASQPRVFSLYKSVVWLSPLKRLPHLHEFWAVLQRKRVIVVNFIRWGASFPGSGLQLSMTFFQMDFYGRSFWNAHSLMSPCVSDDNYIGFVGKFQIIFQPIRMSFRTFTFATIFNKSKKKNTRFNFRPA